MQRMLINRRHVQAFVGSVRHEGFAAATTKTFRYLGNRRTIAVPSFTRFHLEEGKIKAIKAANAQFMSRRPDVKTALWVMPDFLHISNGGPNTILRFAHAMSKRGIKVHVAIVDGNQYREPRTILREILDEFGQTGNLTVSYIPSGQVEKLAELPAYDMAFATLWTTAFFVGQYIKASSYFYFIQDFESLFYPASTEYQLADLTYEFGYFGVFNTPGLKDAVLSQHSMSGVAFSPGVDSAVYYPPAHPQNVAEYPIRVVFYGRPAVPRNLFELGVDTLREMKRVFKDKIDIVVVGSPHAPVRLDFQSRWLGYLPYKETGKLYRSAHVGIALMATPHPSYLPIQLMACGTVPLAIQSPYTQWLLDDGVNSICSRPTALDMLARFSDAVADAESFARLREGAIATAQRYDWSRAVNDTLSQILSGNRDAAVARSRSWERAAAGTEVAE